VSGSSPSSSWRARGRSPALATVAVAALAAATLAGQEPDSSAAATTLGGQDPDSAAADTATRVAPLPTQVIPGPLPIGSRVIFTADSLAWLGAETLSDLLARVPGVFVARGGSYGRPEVPMLGGRGARTLEIYWDGVPLDALGRDSLYADATRVPLAFVERVEVLYRPAGLRVDLVSQRHAARATKSIVRIQRGEFDGAGYRGLFLHRYASGLGLAVGADANETNGATSASGFQGLDLWLRLEYVPRAGIGAAMQYWQATTEREGGDVPSGGTLLARNVTRRYQQLTMFVDRIVDGRGLRIEGFVGSTTADGDSVVDPHTMRHAALTAIYRTPTWSATGTARVRSDRIPLATEIGLGWTPWTPLTLGARLEAARYGTGWTGARLLGTASLKLPLGLWLRGAVDVGDELEAPALQADTSRKTLDVGAFVGWSRSRFHLEAGMTRRDAYAPLAPPELAQIPALAPAAESNYATLSGSLSPVAGVTLGGWYEHPVAGGADFAPPNHGTVTASFRSKFWRTFRSGVFDMRLAVQLESWSTGTAGVDAAGPIVLPGASFINTSIQVQIAGFQIYWHMRNFTGAQESFVPGYPYGAALQRFGARWVFDN
jgi:hypothetical protein